MVYGGNWDVMSQVSIIVPLGEEDEDERERSCRRIHSRTLSSPSLSISIPCPRFDPSAALAWLAFHPSPIPSLFGGRSEGGGDRCGAASGEGGNSVKMDQRKVSRLCDSESVSQSIHPINQLQPTLLVPVFFFTSGGRCFLLSVYAACRLENGGEKEPQASRGSKKERTERRNRGGGVSEMLLLLFFSTLGFSLEGLQKNSPQGGRRRGGEEKRGGKVSQNALPGTHRQREREKERYRLLWRDEGREGRGGGGEKRIGAKEII